MGSFSSPTSFAYHIGHDLIVNGVNIFNEINGAINYWKAPDYNKFGFDVGHALAMVIIGEKKKTFRAEPFDTRTVILPFAKALEIDIDEKCVLQVQNEKYFKEQSTWAFTIMGAKTKMHMRSGMKLFAKTISEMSNEAFSECGDVQNTGSVARLMRGLTRMSTADLFYNEGEHLRIVGSSENIYHEMNG